MSGYCNSKLITRLATFKILIEIAILLTGFAFMLVGHDERVEAAKTLLETQRLVSFQNEKIEAIAAQQSNPEVQLEKGTPDDSNDKELLNADY